MRSQFFWLERKVTFPQRLRWLWFPLPTTTLRLPWSGKQENREEKKKKMGDFHHASRVRNPFLLLQLELKGFMDLLPSSTSIAYFQVSACRESRLGDFGGKNGEITTGLVMSYSLLSQSECCHFTFQSSHIAASYVLSRYCSCLQWDRMGSTSFILPRAAILSVLF